MIKRSVFKKSTISNVYIRNNNAAKYTKQKLIQPQGVIGKYTITVGDKNNLIWTVDRTSKEIISKDIETWKILTNLNTLAFIDPLFQTECPFFSIAHGTFIKIYHIWDHKTSLN